MRLLLPCLVSACPPGKDGRSRRAFTLLEMLVVLIIIAIIAGLALPSIRGNSQSAAINAACRQLVADFSFARQRAIAQRGTVAVVFLSLEVFDPGIVSGPKLTTNEVAEIFRLYGAVCTHYAIYQYRKVGEQPGTRQTGGYITEWKALPEGTFIPYQQFDGDPNDSGKYITNSFFAAAVPAKFRFPFSSSEPVIIGTRGLPYVAFDHDGRRVVVTQEETGQGQVMFGDRDLPVARGVMVFSRLPDGTIDPSNVEAVEVPPNNSADNLIRVDGLTGRARRVEASLK